MSQARFAVVFRTHFWDEFATRQLERLKGHVGRGDVYVLVDETHGKVTGIAHDKVVSVTNDAVLGMGLADAGEDALLWFNGDYPFYYFQTQHPDYDYYLMLEYDCNFNCSIDIFVDEAERRSVDFVGLTKGDTGKDWWYYYTCAELYPEGEFRNQLICTALFSKRALELLLQRRLDLSDQLREKEISAWPMCEGFVPTELNKAGFSLAELSDFGSTESYNWWPPHLEDDLPSLAKMAFLHPVLDSPRYVASVVKHEPSLKAYLNPWSVMHRRLRGFPMKMYLPLMPSAIRRRLKMRSSWSARARA